MIWDLPTRLFHWLLVFSVIGAFVTSQIDAIAIHERMGLTIMGLVLFRIIWGFIGHTPSKFISFIPTPAKLLAYIKNFGQKTQNLHSGHNPMGALSVLAFILLLTIQTLSGALSTDDIFFEGPLVHFVHLSPFGAEVTTEIAGKIHSTTRLLILALILTHCAALIFHRVVKGEKLVSRMLTGGTNAGVETPSKNKTAMGLCLIAACLIICHALPLLKHYF